MMTRKEVLEMAEKCVCTDRNEQYGEPEDNFKAIADFWNVYLKHAKPDELSARDVANMMTLFKIARMSTGTPKEDNYVDAIGYLACGCEIALGVDKFAK